MEEHTIIMRALKVLEQMAVRAQKNEPVEPADVETLISFLAYSQTTTIRPKKRARFFQN
jgi:hemerythrin-like domain-containing protein